MTNYLMKKSVKEQETKYLWAIYAVKEFAIEKLGKRKEAISTINKFNPKILELFLSGNFMRKDSMYGQRDAQGRFIYT